MEAPDKKEYRILVIGKAGNGKSATCNTIVGSPRFEVGRSFSATTRTSRRETVTKDGRRITVIDTPDVTNCDMTQREMEDEVTKWRELADPSRTAVLLAIRCDVRYTAEEYTIYRTIKQLLGDNLLKHRLVVAFTFGDCQDEPIEEELKTVCPELKSVLRDAEHRYVVFKNKADNKEEQVQQLMHRLDEVVNSKPPMYSLLLVLVLVSMVGLTNFIWSRGVFGDVWLLFKRHLWSWIDWFGDQTPKENTEL